MVANPVNQELIVAAGGLVASIIDPNPANDYPGSLDELVRGTKILIKRSGISRFKISTSKFDYFFGKVKASVNSSKKEIANAYKSNERAGIFKQLGIDESDKGRDKMINLIDEALDSGIEVSRFSNEYGTTVVKQIEVSNGNVKGTVNVSFLFKAGDAVPSVTTAVPEIK